MTWRLIIGAEAQRDIEESGFHYESQRVGLGDRFLNELDQLLQRMSGNPLQFPEIGRGIRRGLLRRFPYAVYFIADKEIIAVLACLHQHRHPDTWKQRSFKVST
jgi:plasmid stabilization system protein ParE